MNTTRQSVWRYYQAAVVTLVFGSATLANLVLPFVLAWLIGWDRGADRPLLGVAVGLLAAVLMWPWSIWMAGQLPATWRLFAWQYERRRVWEEAHGHR
jgi:hypothetical protein